MTRRVTHCSGAHKAAIAKAKARRPKASAGVTRAARPCSQSARMAPTARDVAGGLAGDLDPQQRAEHARGLGEGLAGEEVAPRGADARIVVVDLQQQRPGGANVGVERVVLLTLGGELRARIVGRCASFDFGVSSASRLCEASRRGARSAITACSCEASGSVSERSRSRSAS